MKIRYWISLAFALATLGIGTVLSGLSPLVFLSLPAFVMTVLAAVVISLAAYGPTEIAAAFRAAFAEAAVSSEARKGAAFFASFQRILLASTVATILIAVIALLSKVNDLTKIGASLAIAVVSPLYAALVLMLVVLPPRAALEKRLAATA
jgi:flagellar motor component MotA